VTEALDGLPALQDHESEGFVLQLRLDLERAVPELEASPALAPDDEDALAKLGDLDVPAAPGRGP